MLEIREAVIDALVIILSLVIMAGIASWIRSFAVRSYVLGIGPKFSGFIDSKITFIGVIHHELSHMLLAIITGAKVKNFSLFRLSGSNLGEVNIAQRGPFIIRKIQQSLTAVAPVICGAVSIYLLYVFQLNTLEFGLNTGNIISIIIAMHIGYHMTLSKQDVKVAFGGIIVTTLILFIVCYFTDFSIQYYYRYLRTILGVILLNLLIALPFRLIAVFKRI